MENLKKAAETLKMYPKLKLGERREGNNGKQSVHSTGIHTIKFTAEPTTTTINKMGVPTKVFKCIVEENGQLYKWFVPVMNKDNTEGHYLIERLQDIKVGEEFTVEMKKQGAHNFIEVLSKGEVAKTALEDEQEIEEEIQIGDDEAFKFDDER